MNYETRGPFWSGPRKWFFSGYLVASAVAIFWIIVGHMVAS